MVLLMQFLKICNSLLQLYTAICNKTFEISKNLNEDEYQRGLVSMF